MHHSNGRQLTWAGCLNVRDLGGLPTADGRRIRSGALIRSDSPHWLQAPGLAELRSLRVVLILDLRSIDEARLNPGPFADDPAYRLVPLIDPAREHERDADGERTRAATYIGSLRRNGARIAAGLAAVADAPDGAVLVHCQEGKDRTGMLVALALRVAGVEPGVIAEDYALSAGCLRERYDADLAALSAETERARLRQLQRTDPETMLSFLQALEDRYAGAAAYLLERGLTRPQLDRLRKRLRG